MHPERTRPRFVGAAIVAALLLTAALAAPIACTPDQRSAAARGSSVAAGAVVDLAACSAAARGPLATYLASGNLASAEPLVAGARSGAVVSDVLCALQAISRAVALGTAPDSPAAPGSAPGSAGPPRGAQPQPTADADPAASALALTLQDGGARLRAEAAALLAALCSGGRKCVAPAGPPPTCVLGNSPLGFGEVRCPVAAGAP